MKTTRIKICGITCEADAIAVAEAGVDAIGLNFYAQSKRFVSRAQAQSICAALPPFVTVVGLFVNASKAEVNDVLSAVPVDVLQFHGDESAEFCRQFNRPWMKALRVQADTDLKQLSNSYASAGALLLDTYQQGVPGGTGKTFDWALARGKLSRPVVLAGGLNAGNVGAAIEALRPTAVDVSGGVESDPGKKDHAKVTEFVAAVRAADAQLPSQH